ncbi:MAG: hypothetical protein Q7V88_19680 [Actinomycetota bacterium]|nr:hypothetical protein [Actinomycetota bacterium]
MNGVLVQFKAAARIAAYLVVAYVAIRLWQDPAGAARGTMGFIEGIGRFFAALIDKVGEFVRALTE